MLSPSKHEPLGAPPSDKLRVNGISDGTEICSCLYNYGLISNSGHQKRVYEVKDQWYLGEEELIDRIEKTRESRESVVYEIPIEAIAKEVSKVSEVSLDQLYSPTRERAGVHGRGMVAYLARVLAGQRVKDIAEHFQRSPMRISQAIIEFENRLRVDESLRKMTAKLKEDLRKLARKKYFVTIA